MPRPPQPPNRTRHAGLCLLVAWALGGCVARSALTPAPLAEGARELRDVAYADGPERDDRKHRLNLFVPAGPGPHPVVVFVHGGGWFFGDREELTDPYPKLGRRLAARGLLTVVISYRLGARHPHPAHIEDVSRAIAWTFAHVHAWGGDPSRVSLMGHSAGAQLVTLAAADPRWLGAHGVSTERLASVVALSAPFDVHGLGVSFPTSVALVQPAFGRDPKVWRAVSPVSHLRGPLPPMFVAWADGDFAVIRRQGEKTVRFLRARGHPVEALEVPFKGHFSVIMDLAAEGDPLGDRVVSFLKAQRAACAQRGRTCR